MEVYLGALLGGVGATVSPCILPLYPAFLAYVSGTGPTRSHARGQGGSGQSLSPLVAALLVWIGVVAGMLIIGTVVAAVAIPLGDFNRFVLPVADLLLISIGILLVIGVNPFARVPQPSTDGIGRAGPVVGALTYGMAFAPIAVPCSGPFLVGIFAFSLTIGDAIGRLLFFAVFGIGFGLPLFIIGAMGQANGASLARFLVRRERILQVVMGAVLLAVGAWDLAANLPLLLP